MRKLLTLFIIILLFQTENFYSQTGIDTHIVFNFSENEGIIQSEVKHVLAMDDFFLITGNVLRASGERTVFIARYSYDGSQIWRKYLPVKSDELWRQLYTYENLKPFGDNAFAIGGTSIRKIGTDTLGHPFIFIFNSDGDSLHHYRFETDKHIELGAVNLDLNGELLLGGIRKPYNIKHTDLFEDTFTLPLPWIGRYYFDYSAQQLYYTGITPGTYRSTEVRNIFILDGDSLITLAAYRCCGSLLHQTHRPYDGKWERLNIHNYSPHTYDIYSSFVLFMNFDYTAQKSRYNGRKVISSFIVSKDPSTHAGEMLLSSQVILIRKYYEPIDYDDFQIAQLFNPVFGTDTIKLIEFNGMLKLREAWNKDILFVKPYADDRDLFDEPPVLEDYELDPLLGRTLFMRADSNGVVKGYEFIEKFSYEPEQSSAQVLQDLDQRRDGKKIVCVGFIDSKEPVTGKWEYSGRMSWIVIMSDTTTSIEPPSTSVNVDEEIEIPFALYPNPATQTLTVEIKEKESSTSMRYEIIDMYGKRVKDGIIKERRTIIDVNTMVSGTYIFLIRDEFGKYSTQMFMKW